MESLAGLKLEGPSGTFAVAATVYKDGRYPVQRKLSQGGEGYTLLCQDQLSGALVVLKGAWWRGVNELSPNKAKAVNEARSSEFHDEIGVLRQLSARVQQVPALIDVFSQRSPTRDAHVAEQAGYVLDEDHYWDEWFAVHQFIGDSTGSSATLGELIRDSRVLLKTEDVVDLVEQITLTLEGLYRRYTDDEGRQVSWVHCDIKPDNILVVGTPRQYFLIDFHSISKIDESARSDNILDRPKGELKIATPDYAPPGLEHMNRVDKRFDIYSLGATLYEAATGTSPGWIATSPSESEQEVRRKIKEQLQEAGVHPALIGVIRQCLVFDEKYRLSRIDNLRSQVAMVGRALVAAEVLQSRGSP
jgi:serine/threonine protein kinase